MKSLENIEKFLLPSRFRKYGYFLILGGIPIILALMNIIVLQQPEENRQFFLDHWGGFLLNIPLSVGLFWILFASETNQDEMYLNLRLKATFHSIRYTFIAILILPVFSIIRSSITGIAFRFPEIGGNLAVVTLLLLYANVAYWWFKRKANQDEE